MVNKLTKVVPLLVLLFSFQNYAAYIIYDVNEISSDVWEYEYTVYDYSPEENEGITIYFDYGMYSDITVEEAAMEWDAITWEPDVILGYEDPGAFDVLALTDIASSEHSFRVRFQWLEPLSTPASQYYEIYNGNDFSVIESGYTQRASVPEPSIICLLGMGLVSFAGISFRRKNNY